MPELPHHIETPVYTFTHSETESRVELVGTVHIAEPSYFRQIQTIIDKRHGAGAAVHYEKIKESDPQELLAAPCHVRIAARCWRSILRSALGTLYTFEKLKLVGQYEALEYRETWENHDVTDLQWLTTVAHPRLLGQVALTKMMSMAIHTMPAETRQKLTLEALYNMVNYLEPPLLMRPMAVDINSAIIRQQDEVALAAADAHFADKPESDLVLLWGLYHMPGLGAGLQNRGFRKTGEQSLVAIHMPERPPSQI